jgi:hypothetical protein
MAIIVQDSFTRANTTNGLGTANTGQAWQAIAGTFGISNNQAYTSANTYNSRAVIQSGVNNGKVSYNITNYVGGEPCLYFRWLNASNHFSVYVNNYTLNGASSDIAAVYDVPTTNGQKLEVEFNGTSIIVRINDVQRLTVTDTNHQANTMHGFGNIGGDINNRYDNFLVEDFNAGAVGTDGSITLGLTQQIYGDSSVNLGLSQQMYYDSTVNLSLTQQIYTDISANLNLIQNIYRDTEALLGLNQIIYKDSEVNLNVNQTIYKDTEAVLPLTQAIYQESEIGLNLRQEIYAEAVSILDLIQEFYEDSQTYITLQLIQEIYKDSSADLSMTQAIYRDSEINLATRQEMYEEKEANLSLTQNVYKDDSNALNLSQTIYSDSFSSLNLVQQMYVNREITLPLLIEIRDDLIQYNEVIRMILNITRKQSEIILLSRKQMATFDVTQRMQSELKM